QACPLTHDPLQERPATRRFVVAGDDVILSEAVALNAKDLLAPRQERFARRQLDPAAAGVLDELVRNVQHRLVGRHSHFRPDAKSIDRCVSGYQSGVAFLVENAARENTHGPVYRLDTQAT